MSAPSSPAPSTILEVIEQWTAAIRRMTYGSPRLETFVGDGVLAFWANVNLPFYNHGVLTSPVVSTEDLQSRIATVVEIAAERERPWMFTACHTWLPEGAEAVFQSMNLAPAMPLTGMIADAILPVQSIRPHDIRRLSGAEGTRVIGLINCDAYGMPVEWAEDADWPSFFGDDVFSYALYDDQGNPASTATVLVTGGWLNVVAVATEPSLQRRGYAVAVMRHALTSAAEATGVRRTVLHASMAGYPVYARMGYRPIAQFTSWGPAH